MLRLEVLLPIYAFFIRACTHGKVEIVITVSLIE